MYNKAVNELSSYRENINKLKLFLGPQVWKMFWVSLMFGILLFLVESSFIFVLQGFLRTIGLVQLDAVILPSWYPSTLTHTVLILITFGVVRGVVYMTRYYLSGATGQMFARLQRERILEYGLRYAEKVTSGHTIALFTDRVGQAAEVLQGAIYLIITLTACILFFAYGIKIAPAEMIIGVTALGIFMLPLKKFSSVISNAGSGLRSEWINVNHTLIQGLRNHFFFKIYSLVESEIKKGKQHLQDYEKHHLKYYMVSALNNHSPNIVGILIICTISFVSIRYIHTTKPIVLISFFYIFIRFTQGLSEASHNIAHFRLHFEGCKELFNLYEQLELANSKRLIQTSTKAAITNPFSETVKIEVNNLSYGFPSQPLLFNHLNLSISKGEILLIKGPSGVGKSTLLMLILGFLKPTSGEILFNSSPVENTQPFLSSVIGYVGPEPYMIVGTIRENILFGLQKDNSVTDYQIIEAMKKAQLDIIKFNLDFFVAEQAALSTGQKQRLSIARAIIRKPKLLILDEATANLDGETEQKFTNSIKDILSEVTTIIISHKPTFDHIATTVLTLEKKTSC
jgi:ATP-binding cassette subfamily B protein AbcA/BmrA